VCSALEETVEYACGSFNLTLLDEPTYTAGSADNVRSYDRLYCFAREYQPSSRHGLICRKPDGTEHSCVLLAAGGATGVHEHSAVGFNDCCFVAVGDMVCSLSLPVLDLKWATKVDAVTCFGVYYSQKHNCLLAHGELEIARLNLRGDIAWSASGMDIFSEGFRVVGDHVQVIDFYHQHYRIDIATGRCELIHR
jgi:hypothetical protein